MKIVRRKSFLNRWYTDRNFKHVFIWALFSLFTSGFLSLTTPLEAKQTICLNMIVKNEAQVIERCLGSVKSIIDYWVIADTGSTDGTQEIIRTYLQDIPGELFEIPWENWGATRTKALRLAQNHSDYILFIDADDILEYEQNFKMPVLTKDQYNMWRGSSTFSYLKPQIIKSNFPWEWIGVTHEYLHCPTPHTQAVLTGVYYKCLDDGSSREDVEKFKKNILLLEKGLETEPKNVRYMFYLAESYRDAKEFGKAIEWYQNRVKEGGWQEEVFYSKLQIAHCLKKLGFPLDLVFVAYQDAHLYRSFRLEPIYYMAEIYNLKHEYGKAYELLQAVDLQHAQKDSLFNEDWILDYGLIFQHSIASYYVGAYQQAIDLCDALLKNPKLPDAWRERTVENRQFPASRIGTRSICERCLQLINDVEERED